MDDLKEKLDSLTREARSLNKELEKGYEEIKKLRAKVRELKEEIIEKDGKLEELTSCISRLRKKIEEKSKEVGNREKAIMNECRRKELLNGRILGSSRSQENYYISLEMKMLNERIEVMRRFILAIAERFGFDFEVFDDLTKISESLEDPVISALLDSISPRKRELSNKEKE
ncbi:uncharacterized protein Eint_081950 [Encephalitozoon intestinalis ATCC 50506]|uniref:Uncharacterized protein n=1 Tax=Encephalitozoon intestinalis (strain ATCC 50506) TaxID=876142 RepID=E0S8B9_ENCIT|nr:uncharacterized protein Eint_081950 [Encephalitozoon intestinalis ATCC 50506]ADM12125.1 hypothetical protein Eint_081950 [Encephalitozoon intestinalis ATCC 50506]UTX46161.1 hypothetical protein GPK93_10g17550 [Encephalitozoon intestinalis]